MTCGFCGNFGSCGCYRNFGCCGYQWKPFTCPGDNNCGKGNVNDTTLAQVGAIVKVPISGKTLTYQTINYGQQ